ncbi:class F sortase [Streptomyces sporangiiformans]|uniref:Class F sortase n=1 Tax=Streptomyces sporangiiformans TaxID=2315329 RepID=A0A505CYI7_9ACTN|nr:class F sortase [Streptomyces sporangiiformans]TPQ17113.1 class F sortase [Streptomyces sporangiiformans]
MAAPQPPEPSTKASSRTARHTLLVPALAVGLGALIIHNSLASSPDLKPQAPPAAVASATPKVSASAGATGAARDATTARALPRSAPQRLSIPKIAVNAPFTALSLGASGQLNAPPDNNNNLVGWFQGGASPGERGSSIVVGHVDTKTGPAVFESLRTLERGSTVNITRADGIVATFKVDSVDSFSKANFPNDRVYADTNSPQLRLITCGGEYDHSAQDYTENVVVFAHLDSAK